MADGKTQSLQVKWDEVPRELYDGDEDAGEFTVEGVVEQYGNYPVRATVLVTVPRQQSWTPDVSTPVGTIPSLPSSVEISFSNGRSYGVNVAWEMPPIESFSEPGVVYVKGSIPGS